MRPLLAGCLFQDHVAACRELFHRVLDHTFANPKQRGRIPNDSREKHEAMALIDKLFEDMKHARLYTEGKIAADPESRGDAIRQDKTDTIDLARQRIGIVPDP